MAGAPAAPHRERTEARRRGRARGILAAAVVVGAFAAGAPAAPAAQAQERFDRVFNWSGYRWAVRATTRPAQPGRNRWGDSRENVRVRSDKTLSLNISGGKSVEIIGPATGYGTYRWVIRTDLSTIDPFRVAAFFVYGNGGEQDVEFARWGDPLLATAGSWVTWRRRTRIGFDFFAVSPAAPYTVVIDWRVGATRFTMHDATGATLLDTASPSSAPGAQAAPRMSYWVYPGTRANVSPFTAASVHPPVIVESFRYRARRR